MSDDFAALDATAQAELVRRRETSPGELVEAAIERLERLNPQLGAVIHPALDRARERAADPDLPDGPFRGVPFLMKDLGGEEAGRPYHAGMTFLRDAGFTASEDSFFVQRAREAGLISLGRTNTPELGLMPVTEPAAHGASRNPWNLDYSPGGSSGGSSAAVAAGIVAAAHASDGGGSIRGPASMCDLVGLKPSRGRISFGPQLGERWSGFSAQFVVTRTVRDCAALLDAFAGPMTGDPYWAAPPDRPYATQLSDAPQALRVGLMREAPRDLQSQPVCVDAVEKMGRVLEGLGHRVEEASPEALEEAEAVANYVAVVACSTARALDSLGRKVGRPVEQKEVEPLTWSLAERGRSVSACDFIGIIEFVHAYGRRIAAWWESGFDLLLTSAQAAPPPRVGEISGTVDEPFRGFVRAAPYGVFTLPFNLTGQPAISLPAQISAEGTPVGVQLVAAAGRDDLLLRVAAQIEQAAPWSQRRPPLFG